MAMNKKTQLQKKIGEKRRLEAIKAAKKSESAKAQYQRYLAEREKQRKLGWQFKEGSVDDFSFDEFQSHISRVKTLLESEKGISPDMLTIGYLTDFTIEEQLQSNHDSIAQACMLWNKHKNLVDQYGVMGPNKFRISEADNFRILRAQYNSDKEYDEAMSY